MFNPMGAYKNFWLVNFWLVLYTRRCVIIHEGLYTWHYRNVLSQFILLKPRNIVTVVTPSSRRRGRLICTSGFFLYFVLAAFKRNPPFYMERLQIIDTVSQSRSCLVAVDYLNLNNFYVTRSCDLRMTSFPDEFPLLPYSFSHRRLDLEESFNGVITTESIKSYVRLLEKKYFSNPKPKGNFEFIRRRSKTGNWHRNKWSKLQKIESSQVAPVLIQDPWRIVPLMELCHLWKVGRNC